MNHVIRSIFLESPQSVKEHGGISVIFTNETPPGNTSPASSRGSPGQKRKLSDIKEIPGRRCSSLEAPSPSLHRLNRSGKQRTPVCYVLFPKFPRFSNTDRFSNIILLKNLTMLKDKKYFYDKKIGKIIL